MTLYPPSKSHGARWTLWLPTPGNAIFVLIVVIGVLWAQSAGAIQFAAPAPTTTTIPYQGRVQDANGAPVNGAATMIFRLYRTNGDKLWEEQQAVTVADGLFSVLLGSVTPINVNVLTDASPLYLGLAINGDPEMTPRIPLSSAPYAVQALTVVDNGITTTKLQDGAVTQSKLAPNVQLPLADNSVTNAKLQANAVTSANIVDGQVTQADLDPNIQLGAAPNSITTAELKDGEVKSADIGDGEVKQADLDPAIQLSLPAGSIIMWSGAAATVPGGWQLCDGSNGTPDLRNRFVVGAGANYNVGDRGGIDSVALTVDNLPSHNHTGMLGPEFSSDNNGADGNFYFGGTISYKDNVKVTFATNNTGGNQPFDNRPPFYALALICKK